MFVNLTYGNNVIKHQDDLCSTVNGNVRLIICADATSMWRTSATRCDVLLEAHKDCGASGKPKNWDTWWILDGTDDETSLRAVDVKAQLNNQLLDIQNSFRFEAVFLNCFP